MVCNSNQHKLSNLFNMKTIFTFLAAICLTSFSFAQITIEETDLMMPGDTFLIHVDLSPEVIIDIANTGSDLSWDFTGLNNDESNYACYAPNDELEFQGEFPLSEFHTYGPGYIYAGPGGGSPLDNWGYMMFYTDASGLFVEGFYSDYGMGYRSTFNTPAELLMFTPADFNDIESNDTYWEVIVNENAIDYDTLYRRDVDKTLEADAWGSIMTDYGNFDVLRIHETGISVDSLFAYMGAITYFSTEVARDTINKYYFWAKEVKHPVITVHCDYYDNIERIDFLMGAIYSGNQIPKFDNHQLYPNPCKDFVILNNYKGKVEIYNSLGQIVKSIEDIPSIYKLSMHDLHTGVYYLKEESSACTRLFISK